MSSCEYCSQDVDDVYLITLPCGYLACYEHFLKQPDPFTCFMCQEHSVQKNVCFSMKKNREKITAINNAYELKIVRLKLNEIKKVKDDPKYFINEVVSGVINKIDLRREQIKLEINTKIDEYFEKLYKESMSVSNVYESYLVSILNGYDLKKVEESLENDSVSLNEVKSNQIKPILNRLELIKGLDFKQGDFIFQFDGEKMFGKISNSLYTESSEPKVQKKSIQFTEIPMKQMVTAKFSNVSVLEMNNGELLSVCKLNPHNLEIWNYEKRTSRELTGHDQKVVLFKLCANDIIVSLSNDFMVRVWEKEVCINHFKIPQITIYLFEIDSTNMIIFNFNFEITVIDLFTGKIINTFIAHLSPVICGKMLKKNQFLTCHSDDFIKLWDLSSGKCLKEFKSKFKIVCLGVLDDSTFVTGHLNGIMSVWDVSTQTIMIQNSSSTVSVRYINVVKSGEFLSYTNEGRLRLWKISGKVLRVVSRMILDDVYNITILSNGRMVTCSIHGEATVWTQTT